MLEINKLDRLYVGIKGENGARTINIDVSAWMVSHPNASISIWHKRNGDSAMAATGASLDSETKILSWTPTSTDTYYAGKGEAQIRLTESNVVKKTVNIPTHVSQADVGSDGNTIPSTWEGYIAEVERVKGLAVTAKNDANTAKTNANTYKLDAEAWALGTRNGTDVSSSDPAYQNNAKYYATQAAEQTVEQAEAARDAAVVAQGKAEDAQTAAENARDAVLGMSVSATGLPAGSTPTATYSSGHMTLGIPKGDKGDQGDKGDTGAQGIQGLPGADGRDGRDAVVIEIGAVEYSFQIDGSGHLILSYGGGEAPDFSINEYGHLIYSF